MALTKEQYRELYEKLDSVFPVPYDCGTICGKACCGVSGFDREMAEEDMGLYLYPGEDELLALTEGVLRVLRGQTTVQEY